MSLKSIVAGFFGWLGYDVRKRTRGFHDDPWKDQEFLLSLDGRDVTTIFDLGANIGQTAKVYHERFPNALIYSFEPFEEAYQALSTLAARSERIRPQKLAVSNESGRARFYHYQSSVTNSLLQATSTAQDVLPEQLIGSVGSGDVDTTTLHEFSSEHDIRHIDILKMDIQGAELLALEEATDLLQDSSIALIYTEVQFDPLYKKQAEFHELCSFLQRYEFSVHRLYDHCLGLNVKLSWADVLFISAPIKEHLHRVNKR